jgi:hypothetical protein
MTRRNDAEAAYSASFEGRRREGDPIKEALTFAGELLRDHGFKKATSTYRRRVDEASMKIILALTELERRELAAQNRLEN